MSLFGKARFQRKSFLDRLLKHFGKITVERNSEYKSRIEIKLFSLFSTTLLALNNLVPSLFENPTNIISIRRTILRRHIDRHSNYPSIIKVDSKEFVHTRFASGRKIVTVKKISGKFKNL